MGHTRQNKTNTDFAWWILTDVNSTTSEPIDFDGLICEVRKGSEIAIDQLVKRFGPQVLRKIRRNLHPKLRSKYDSLDFVQEVWKSFFTSNLKRMEFSSKEDLEKLLGRIAQNKIIDINRQRFGSTKYSIHREETQEACHLIFEELAGTDATPSQIVMSSEEWDAALATQPPVYQQVLRLFAKGLTLEEIAIATDLATRSIRRIIGRFRMALTSNQTKSD